MVSLLSGRRSLRRGASCRGQAVRRSLLAGGLGATGALVAWAAFVEPRTLLVRRSTLRLPGWPERLSGLRIAVVADLHAGGPHVSERRLDQVVERVNRETPDLVALLGDYVDPVIPGIDPMGPESVAAHLGRLRAPLGSVAVLGNHDWRNDGARVAEALRAVGIPVLENDAVALGAHGGRLWVAGIADLRERDFALESALAPVDNEAPVVLLTHDPDVFPAVPERVSLTIAGHLHGAQIDLAGVRRLTIPSRFGTRYLAGHRVEGARHLYVSRGVGTSGLPLRLRAPATVEVLELVAGGDDRAREVS